MGFCVINQRTIYYRRQGSGEPLLLLHGNTASGKMFNWEINFYSRYFDVVVPDYPGHGKSIPLGDLLSDYWYDNAIAMAGLCRQLGLEQVNVIGTSGGALVALNLALEAPELIKNIIADSFEGIKGNPEDGAYLKKLRKNDGLRARLFYLSQHGWRWRKLVDTDTNLFCQFGVEQRPYLHRSLTEIKCPVLITGSRQDDFIDNIETRMQPVVKQIADCQLFLFARGGHPAMYSNRKQFSRLALSFLRNPL